MQDHRDLGTFFKRVNFLPGTAPSFQITFDIIIIIKK